ncbi:ribosomal protein S6 glutaminyl transferase [Cellulophaga phage phi14:2]|uniref:ATP-grasp domain containing protein n=1 Tax=Cellulophaga phage phi14:2 TaxID=1327990 RepID=S0A3B0_9CAUD|nr:ribosomal protein S6 glutaminyl transferase [Cellulophaga phage phi14:2]AGO48927.1 ATP-grasp domain containing protein [Cellulophaga phage phi14:2]
MKKRFTKFKPQVYSRHPSHAPLRLKGALELLPFKSVVRFGSPTEVSDSIAKGGNRVELNTTSAIANSSNKRLMKECFTRAEVKTAMWWTYDSRVQIFIKSGIGDSGMSRADLPYPIVAKHNFGSRGRGNTKINTAEEMQTWLSNNNRTHNFIFEVFHNFSREYRLHVSEHGCFYTCRKMIKSDTADEDKWFRNDSNSVWILEDNESFDKPVNWDEVEEHCVKALKSVGLDFGAVDLKIQAANSNGTPRTTCDFIVIEINSAPSFGDITLEKYKEVLPQLLKTKREKQTV